MSINSSSSTIIYRPQNSLDLDLEAGIPQMTAPSLSETHSQRHPSSSSKGSAVSAVGTTTSSTENPFEDCSQEVTRSGTVVPRDSISSSSTMVPSTQGSPYMHTGTKIDHDGHPVGRTETIQGFQGQEHGATAMTGFDVERNMTRKRFKLKEWLRTLWARLLSNNYFIAFLWAVGMMVLILFFLILMILFAKAFAYLIVKLW
ncbi:hypothetical protein EX30DRAFT_366846 [Ascodesmis nigricans]|uniref:Uncharacterized protein n=1 Tax=Ascodesmis nigricans TaxID=341454 RepID=A0A4S2MR50_9PEZI|nr:hypothetical protein EX30DRAFT_366846 [Ascodesmis nigricans]